MSYITNVQESRQRVPDLSYMHILSLDYHGMSQLSSDQQCFKLMTYTDVTVEML